MNTTTLVSLLQIAAVLHLGLAWAGATMSKVVGLGQHLAPLPPFIRRLFYTYFCFIALMLVAFGSLTFVFANNIAAGEPAARGLCLLMLCFWVVRLLVAAFVFDVRSYLTNWFLRLGYQATNVVFIYLVLAYALALWKGGKL
jgi:hypothetical protein